MLLTLAASAATQRAPLGGVAALLKKAAPGDTIVVEKGVYNRQSLVLAGNGAENNPIVIMAEAPGAVVIEGESSLRLTGKWMTVAGLHFRNGFSPTGTIIEFRNGSRHAFDCRVTDCVIEGFNPPARAEKGNWIQMYGQRNRLDHCSIVGKLNEGVTVTAVLDGVNDQHHRIDNNYFGPRPVYGSNGAETIRTGNSFTWRTRAAITIEDNYFDRCSGEVEILSIKSSDNIIRRNTFYECEGDIALRHGDRNTVEGNLMIGNHKPNTGGIRVINTGHRIYGNYLEGLAGGRQFSAFSIMNGVPDSPDYRYHRVRDVQIHNNTLVDCDNIVLCLGRDFERTATPIDVTFTDNLIFNRSATATYTALDDVSGIAFSGNLVELAPGADIPAGFAPAKAAWVKSKEFPAVYARTQSKGYAGAIDPARADKARFGVKKEAVGALWFKYTEADPRTLSGKVIKVAAGQNALAEAASASAPGDVLELSENGEYWNDKPVFIPHYLVIRAAAGLKGTPTLRYNGKGGESLIVIRSGGHLDIKGIAFNGIPEQELRDPKGFINTDEGMLEDYSLLAEGCEFSRFNRSGTFAISCTQGAFAQWVRIRGCRFVDLPWDAIVLSRETDFYGRYNVENLEVSDCLFANICGCGIDLARYGYDESTAGPNAVIDRCTFYNVFNREQGSVVDLSGVQKVRVTGCSFELSGQGGASVRLNEMRRDEITISRNNLFNAGRIFTFWGTGVKDDNTALQPVYADPANGDWRQAASSPLKGVGIN